MHEGSRVLWLKVRHVRSLSHHAGSLGDQRLEPFPYTRPVRRPPFAPCARARVAAFVLAARNSENNTCTIDHRVATGLRCANRQQQQQEQQGNPPHHPIAKVYYQKSRLLAFPLNVSQSRETKWTTMRRKRKCIFSLFHLFLLWISQQEHVIFQRTKLE
jgi:hypothetical protein